MRVTCLRDTCTVLIYVIYLSSIVTFIATYQSMCMMGGWLCERQKGRRRGGTFQVNSINIKLNLMRFCLSWTFNRIWYKINECIQMRMYSPYNHLTRGTSSSCNEAKKEKKKTKLNWSALSSLIQLWPLTMLLQSYFAYNSINFAIGFMANRCEIHSNWNDIGNRNGSSMFFFLRRIFFTIQKVSGF